MPEDIRFKGGRYLVLSIFYFYNNCFSNIALSAIKKVDKNVNAYLTLVSKMGFLIRKYVLIIANILDNENIYGRVLYK